MVEKKKIQKELEKSEKEIIEKEIDCWKMHLESVDKTNFENSNAKSIMSFNLLIVIMATSIIGLISLEELKISYRLIGVVMLCLVFIYFIKKSRKKYDNKIKCHNLGFIVRERMLRERYELLGVKREKLDREFEDIKKIYQNPLPSMREYLIKEYYKNKKSK